MFLSYNFISLPTKISLPRCREECHFGSKVGSGTASNEGVDESALAQSPLLCSI